MGTFPRWRRFLEFDKILDLNNFIRFASQDPLNMASSKYGCKHYIRRCALLTPCCNNKVYPCRVCHDENEDHQLDRKTVNTLKCLQCGKEQDVSATCVDCGIHFGLYTCLKCRMFDDNKKGQFHCDECGICRVGGRENFYHCPKCDICLPMSHKDSKCIEKGARNNCPICMEDIHTSRIPGQVAPCGHIIHTTCFSELLNSGSYTCPLCNRSLVDMDQMWRQLDDEISRTPMPKEYENVVVEIKCRDCQKDSKVKFHVLGHKCQHCNSYNTSREKIEGLPENPLPVPVEVNVEAPEDDDDEWTTEEEEEVHETSPGEQESRTNTTPNEDENLPLD